MREVIHSKLQWPLLHIKVVCRRELEFTTRTSASVKPFCPETHSNPIPKRKSALGKILPMLHKQLNPPGQKENKMYKKTQTQHKKKSGIKRYPIIIFPRVTQVLCPSIISVGVLVITAIIHSKKEANSKAGKNC